jgi:hypothetical protein
MLSEIEGGIAEQYQKVDASAEIAYRAIAEIVSEAERQISEVVAEAEGVEMPPYGRLSMPRLERRDERRRSSLRNAALADLKSKVEAANLRLDRVEADLLRQLSLDALESDEAKRFLSEIPSVPELVPVVRLAELEVAMGSNPRPQFG